MRYSFWVWIAVGAIAPLACGSDPPQVSEPAELRGKSVLVLHSYYKGYRWTDDEGRGIDSVLLPEVGASNLYIEYMDTKRFFGPDSLERFPDVYGRKFMGQIGRAHV